MPFTAWKQEEKNRHKDLFTMTSGGFVIIVTINSLNDSIKQNDEIINFQ